MKKKVILLIALCIVLAGVVYLSTKIDNSPVEKIGYALDTQIRIVIYDRGADKNISEEAYNEILRLDKLLSNFNTGSETYKLNQVKKLVVSDELKEILSMAKMISEDTGGAYDVTVYPLTKLWNFKKEYVPSDNEIKKAQASVNIENLIISGNEVTLLNNAEVDISSIAKGYIADKIINLLKDRGIRNALVDAGGNIKVMGNSDLKISSGFKIGIQDPHKDTGVPFGNIVLKDSSVVTSGIYERNFVADGEFYHHILDTKTGRPTVNEVISVSVICENSAKADAYATAVMVLGSEKGLELINSHDDMECIIVRDDNTVVTSGGVANFTINGNNYKKVD